MLCATEKLKLEVKHKINLISLAYLNAALFQVGMKFRNRDSVSIDFADFQPHH
jgi:hypothetical protein